jgi:hypothetical protein
MSYLAKDRWWFAQARLRAIVLTGPARPADSASPDSILTCLRQLSG